MEITKDTVVRERWHRGFEREAAPTEIVIHATGGGQTYQFVAQGGRKAEYIKGESLFHYLIERSGKTIELIDPERWVWHSSSGAHDKTTIGIECENLSYTNDGPLEDIQYDSLVDLLKYLINRYPTIKRIVGHNYNGKKYSNRGKNCPGTLFCWETIEIALELTKIEPECYSVS